MDISPPHVEELYSVYGKRAGKYRQAPVSGVAPHACAELASRALKTYCGGYMLPDPMTLWVIALTMFVALVKLEPKRRNLTRRELSERLRTPRSRSARTGFVIKPRTHVR
jgi:hypothetical protein